MLKKIVTGIVLGGFLFGNVNAGGLPSLYNEKNQEAVQELINMCSGFDMMYDYHSNEKFIANINDVLDSLNHNNITVLKSYLESLEADFDDKKIFLQMIDNPSYYNETYISNKDLESLNNFLSLNHTGDNDDYDEIILTYCNPYITEFNGSEFLFLDENDLKRYKIITGITQIINGYLEGNFPGIYDYVSSVTLYSNTGEELGSSNLIDFQNYETWTYSLGGYTFEGKEISSIIEYTSRMRIEELTGKTFTKNISGYKTIRDEGISSEDIAFCQLILGTGNTEDNCSEEFSTRNMNFTIEIKTSSKK